MPVRKAANLSISAELLARAREHGINLSATLEQALIAAVKEKERERWLAENHSAIAAYNELVDERGVFSDGMRGF